MRATSRSVRRRARAVVLAMIVAATSASLALADVAPRLVRAQGTCTRRGQWVLAIRRLDAETLAARLEISHVRPYRRWHVFMEHDGVGLRPRRKDSGPDGSFVVRRRVPDHPGVDVIGFAARERRTRGQECRGRASFLS